MVESAGLLVYRKQGDSIEVLLTHPGGPIWGRRDVWSIPKGEVETGENLQQSAVREFKEELGFEPPTGLWVSLGFSAQGTPTRKINHIWAIEGSIDLTNFSSNSFTMEWPPKSGRTQEFPENDKAQYMDLNQAATKLFPEQVVFLERLTEYLGLELPKPPEQQTLV